MTDAATAAAPGRIVSRFSAESTALEVIAGIDLTGRNAVVTGGASGLGVETARALASAGAAVTLAVRDLAAGARVAATLNAELGEARVNVGHIDLGDLATIRAFAADWGDKQLSLLVNNAGVMACPQGYTKDGFETQFGANHLGHFLLGVLLTPALEKGAPSRLISLSSSGHQSSDIHFDDPNFRARDYHPFKAYGQSKTANALFAVEYDRRHRDRGVRAFSVMPGVISTPLMRHITPEMMAELSRNSGKAPAEAALKYKTPQQGAATSVWAATARELDGFGGQYLEDCGEAPPFSADLPRGHGVKPHALDPVSAARLWALSEEACGLTAGRARAADGDSG